MFDNSEEPMAKIGLNNEKIKYLYQLVESDFETKLTVLKHYLEASYLLVNQILEDEVKSLAGERYSREKPRDGRYSRWGSNPGSVRLGEEKVRIDVPRVYDNELGKNVSLSSYEKVKNIDTDEGRLINGVLCGLSTNDYRGVVEHFSDSIGLSHSSISNRFIEESSKALKEFHERDISQYNIVALFIDGKYLAKEQIVIVLGITDSGDKIALDFIQTTTENSTSIRQLLSSLVGRGLKYEEGLLCVVDGSKGLYKAIDEVFGKYAVVQRCQWHKRENVLSYLNEIDKERYKKKLNKAYRAESYDDAKLQLEAIRKELEQINQSAANSLSEGLEETLTLHRLGLNETFGKSFSTTNVIENVNSQIKKYTNKVKYWKTSDQRHRWIVMSLLRAEQRMRKVDNYQKLSEMKKAISEEVKRRLNN